MKCDGLVLELADAGGRVRHGLRANIPVLENRPHTL